MSRILAFFRKISNKVASILSIGLATTLICVPLANNFSITYEENFLKTNLVKANDLIMGPSSIQIDLKQSYTDDVLPTYLVLNASENVTLQASEGTSLPEGLSIKKTTTDQDGVTSFVLVPDNSQLMPGEYTFSLQAIDNGVTYAETGNITLTVLPNYAETINITSANAIEVNKSDSYSTQLTATVSPANANQNVKWFLQETANGVSISESGLLFIPGNIDPSEFEIVVGCVSEEKNYQNQPVSETETISITIKEIYASSITISSPEDINLVYLDNSNWSYQFSYSLSPENATTDTDISYLWVNNQSIPGMNLSNTGLLSISDTNLLTVGSHNAGIQVNYINKENNQVIFDQITINVNVAYAHAESVDILNIQDDQTIDGGVIAQEYASDWSFLPQAVVNPSNASPQLLWTLTTGNSFTDYGIWFTINEDTGEIKLSQEALSNFSQFWRYNSSIGFQLKIKATAKENSLIFKEVNFRIKFKSPNIESFSISSPKGLNQTLDLGKECISIDINPFPSNSSYGFVTHDVIVETSGPDAEYFQKFDYSSLLEVTILPDLPNEEWVFNREFHITVSESLIDIENGTRIDSSNQLDFTITFTRPTPTGISLYNDENHTTRMDQTTQLNVYESNYSEPITSIYPVLTPNYSIQDSISVSILGDDNNYFKINKIKYDYNFYKFEIYFDENTPIGEYNLDLSFYSSEYSDIWEQKCQLIINIQEPLVESVTIVDIEDSYIVHLSEQWSLSLNAIVNPLGIDQTVSWELVNSSDNFIIDNSNSSFKLKYLENVDSEIDEQITIRATSVINTNISADKTINIHFIYDEIESLLIDGNDRFNVVFPNTEIITNFKILTFPEKANPNVIWNLSGADSSKFSIIDGYLKIKDSSDLKPGEYIISVKATSIANAEVFNEKQIVINYYSDATSVSIVGINDNQNFSVVEGNTNIFASAIANVNPSTAKQKVNWIFSIKDTSEQNAIIIANETDNEVNFALSNEAKAGQTFSCTLMAETDIDSIGNTKQTTINFTVNIKSPLAPTSLSIKDVDDEYEIYNDNDEIIIQPSVIATPLDASNSVVWTLQQSSNDFAIDSTTGSITLINHNLINTTRTIAIEATSIYDNNIKDAVSTNIKIINNIIVPASISITNIENDQQFNSYLGNDSVIVKAIASVNPITASKSVQWTLSGKDSNEFLLNSQTGELKLSLSATIGVKELIISVESTLDPMINDYVKIIVNVLEPSPQPTNDSTLILILSICIPLAVILIILIIILSIYFSRRSKNKIKG